MRESSTLETVIADKLREWFEEGSDDHDVEITTLEELGAAGRGLVVTVDDVEFKVQIFRTRA